MEKVSLEITFKAGSGGARSSRSVAWGWKPESTRSCKW